MKISIVIPAYNEEKRIGKMLDMYSVFFEGLREDGKLDYEFLIVINNTRDKTSEIVEEVMKVNKRIRYIDLVRGGKGYAITEGFREVIKGESDLVGFVDADMATSPESFYDLIRKMNGFDGAIADRYIWGAEVYPPNTFRRLVVSRIFNILIRGLFFFPYRDTQCGAKVFRRKVIEEVLPKLSFSFWAFDVDLLYNVKTSGYRIRCVPTVWVDKEYSKINFWNAGPWMALSAIRLRLINSWFVGFLRFYDYIFNLVRRL